MNTKETEKHIKEYFKDFKSFTREELFAYLKKFDKDISYSTLGWRIYDLNKRMIIRTLSRGVYTINKKSDYIPAISNKLKNLYSISKNLFKYQYDKKELNKRLCIWDTKWLNEFMIHQMFASFIVIESIDEALSGLYFKIKNKGFRDVYIEPDRNIFVHNIVTDKEPVILKRIYSNPPVISVNNVNIASLEKILVDLFCDKETFYAFQGSELVNIYKNSIKRYNLNIGKIIQYSRRRRREIELKKFLLEHLKEEVKGIIK